MAVTGMSGHGAGVLPFLADPEASALRVALVTGALTNNDLTALRVALVSGGNTYQSLLLLNASNTSGAGGTFTATMNGGGYGAGFYFLQVSGNSATANFQGSPDGTNWFQISAATGWAGATATGQWSGFYPYLRGGVVWASGGGNTATVSLRLTLL